MACAVKIEIMLWASCHLTKPGIERPGDGQSVARHRTFFFTFSKEPVIVFSGGAKRKHPIRLRTDRMF